MRVKEKLSLVILRQHNFYIGVESEVKAVMQNELVEQYLLQKIKEEYLNTHDVTIKNYVNIAIDRDYHKAKLHSEAGDYEVDISDIDYIENL
jgi:hypothetical protein